MSRLITINGINESEILNGLLNNEITVYEDIQGSKIWFNWDGKNVNIKPKSLSNENLNIVDLAVQKYYIKAIEYFESLDKRTKSILGKKWWFCFEYFPDNQPGNIIYQRTPKNNLVLTNINKNGKYSFNLDELEEYARLMDVDVIPVVFKGKLTEKMKEAIKYFVNTSEKDLEYVFGEKSFSYFFYKILNPSSNGSFLMGDDFQENVEKLIIFYDKENTSFELLNPLYKRISSTANTEYTEIYSLILLNFVIFLQSIDLNKINPTGNNKGEAYLSLMCKLFNIYMTDTKEDLRNFEIIVPKFFDRDKFKINKELISNETTRMIIDEDEKFEYIFKIFLGSFNKKKKKPIGLFNDVNIELFNNLVDEIEYAITYHLNKKSELDLKRTGLMDFNDYFKIKYDVDSQGEVYPDIYDEFGSPKISKKKSMKDEFPKKDFK